MPTALVLGAPTKALDVGAKSQTTWGPHKDHFLLVSLGGSPHPIVWGEETLGQDIRGGQGEKQQEREDESAGERGRIKAKPFRVGKERGGRLWGLLSSWPWLTRESGW